MIKLLDKNTISNNYFIMVCRLFIDIWLFSKLFLVGKLGFMLMLMPHPIWSYGWIVYLHQYLQVFVCFILGTYVGCTSSCHCSVTGVCLAFARMVYYYSVYTCSVFELCTNRRTWVVAVSGGVIYGPLRRKYHVTGMIIITVAIIHLYPPRFYSSFYAQYAAKYVS